MKLNVLLFCLVLPLGVFSEDPDRQDLRSFADHLFNKGDYDRAITEYERFVFLQPEDSKAPEARLQIAEAYVKLGNTEKAIEQFKALQRDLPRQSEGKKAALRLAEVYYQSGRYANALDELEKYLADHSKEPGTEAIHQKMSMCHLRLGEVEAARMLLASMTADSQSKELLALTDRYDDIPGKSPALAAGLSAIMPGAGQLYVKKPHDALIAFLLNGVFIWAAVEAFDNDEYVTGALISAMEAGWYFGNIYNAANNAHKFNRRENEKFFEKVDVRVGPLTYRSSTDRDPDPGLMAFISVKF